MSERPFVSGTTPLILGFSALSVLVIGLGGWGALARLDGAVVAPGHVEVAGRRQVVQHPQGGTITEILARDGDIVAAGQILLRLDDARLRPELAVVEGQLLEILARRDRLAAERDSLPEIRFSSELLVQGDMHADVRDLMAGQVQQFEAGLRNVEDERRGLEERKIQIARQLEGLDAQLEATVLQVELLEQELSSVRVLYDKGLARQAELLGQQRALASLRGTVGQILASSAEGAARIVEIDVEILRLASERRKLAISEMRDLEFREIELRETKTRLASEIARLDVPAPAAGVVYGSRVDTVGAVIGPGEIIMSVVPRGTGLVVQAMVEPLHVDEIQAGQDVVLRFSAFNGRTTPEVLGSVAAVSADAYTDERTGLSHYRAEIHLSSESGAALAGRELLPGMPVETFIKTGERSPLSYLIKPLADYFMHAFRET